MVDNAPPVVKGKGKGKGGPGSVESTEKIEHPFKCSKRSVAFSAIVQLVVQADGTLPAHDASARKLRTRHLFMCEWKKNKVGEIVSVDRSSHILLFL